MHSHNMILFLTNPPNESPFPPRLCSFRYRSPGGTPGMTQSADPFFCDICNYGFDQEFKLNNHKKGQVHKAREAALADPRSSNSRSSSPATSFKPSQSSQFGVAPNFQNVSSSSYFPQSIPDAAAPENSAQKTKSMPPTADEIEAAIATFKEKYIEVDDPKTGKKKQKLIVPDEWEFCKPCGAHLRTQQVTRPA